MNVCQSTLENGIRIITAAMPHVESAALGVWVGVGSRCETRVQAGVSHFIEHLLFKGTGRRSARDISRVIEGRGGYLNAFTQEESTCYYARVAFDQFNRALDVLTDMIVDPRLDPADVDKERGVIIEEIMMYRDQPRHVVQEMLSRALWPGHPLGRAVIGTPESLAGMNRAQIRAFKERHYVPSRLVVAFAGRVEHNRCVDRVAEGLGRLKGTEPRRPRRVTHKVAQTRFDIQGKPIEQAHLAMGFRLFGRRDPRRYTLRILNAILGENMSSRLFQVVREKHGLAYSVHSCVHLFQETGVLEVSAGLDRRR
ncbi:MAG: insulinase family protein, partial [Lentisphaerae bacterium]|nr:insulinase family protein [Lentisphaerota bacterium]